jgi:hypothetical protein
MKRSNRYMTRFSAKKKTAKDREKKLEVALAACSCHLREIARLQRELAEAKRGEPGITTIRIGKTLPGFRGNLLGISLTVDVQQFLYMARYDNRSQFWNVSSVIGQHCRDVSHQMEIAMLDYVQKEGLQ